MKYWHKTAAVAVLAAGLVVAGVFASRRGNTPEEKFSRLSDRLLCQCGCGQHLNGCTMHPCGSAYPMRDQIRAGIAASKSEDDIVQGFVKEMGQVVLAAPATHGFALAAWLMPVFALLLGLYVVLRVVKGPRVRQALATAGGPPPVDAKRDALLKRYSAGIDEDLEREQ